MEMESWRFQNTIMKENLSKEKSMERGKLLGWVANIMKASLVTTKLLEKESFTNKTGSFIRDSLLEAYQVDKAWFLKIKS